MPGIAAYGADARRWRRCLPAETAAVLADATAMLPAYADALRRRTAGETFFIGTHVPDDRCEIALAVAAATTDETYDRRRAIYDQLAAGTLVVNSLPASQQRVYDGETLAALRDLHVLADAILVRSPLEYERLATLLGRRRVHVGVYAQAPADVAGAPSTREGTLVVWAPNLPWERTTLFATAVEEMRRPAVIVAATLPPATRAARYVLADEGREELARATAAIDAELYDPGVAMALCELGVPLAAAATSGVQSFVDGVELYEPWNWRSIQMVAYGLLGGRPPEPRAHGYDRAALASVLAAAAPPPIEDGPLVTYIVPTYNRLDGLEATLRCLAAQTYKNIECIVVNDAGEPVDDVVARFPGARAIDMPTNTKSAIKPINLGATYARGKYVGLLADDDINYPDHVARLVDVLERTGLAVAHGNIGVRFLERSEPGAETYVLDSTHYRTYGYSASRGAAHMDPQANLVNGRVSLQAMLIRRDLLEEMHYVSEEFEAIADHELLLRLSLRTDWAHSDHLTCEWCRRSDTSNFCANLPTDWNAIYPKLWARHPFTDRPTLQEARRKFLEGLLGGPMPAEFLCLPTVIFPKEAAPVR